MKPNHFCKLRKTLDAITRQRADYRKQVRAWVKRLRDAIDRVAYFFTPEELVLILAAYEMLPEDQVRKAEFTDFSFPTTDRECEFDEDYDHPGLQHVIAQWFDWLKFNAENWDSIVRSGSFVPLLEQSEDDVEGVSDRVRSLSAEEALALLVMLEAARALPHGICSYPGWWTSRALLGMLKRASQRNPWTDGESEEAINFDAEQGFAGEIAAVIRASKAVSEDDGDTREVNHES